MPAWEANTDKILNEDGSLTLEVKETYAIDLVPKKNPSGSRGIVRIDYAAGEAINLSWTAPDFLGDVVEIMGSRKTASLVSPLHKLDFGDDKQRPWRIFTKQKEAKRFIRMDPLARLNAGCKIGDRVSVRKIDVPIASKIVVTPDYSMRGTFHFIENVGVDQTAVFLRRSLSKRPLTEGDKIMVALDMGYDDFGKKRTGEASLVIKVNEVFVEAAEIVCDFCLDIQSDPGTHRLQWIDKKHDGKNICDSCEEAKAWYWPSNLRKFGNGQLATTARVSYFSTIFKINPPTGGGDYAWG